MFDDDVQSEPLRLPARVVWCTALDDTNQIGVAFKPLDARRTEYLAVFLRYLDHFREGVIAKASALRGDVSILPSGWTPL